MKVIDRNGRLFGKISIIDVLVIAVVLVMGAALSFKSNQTHTGGNVSTAPISYQILVRGTYPFVGDAIQLGDDLFDPDRNTGGSWARSPTWRSCPATS